MGNSEVVAGHKSACRKFATSVPAGAEYLRLQAPTAGNAGLRFSSGDTHYRVLKVPQCARMVVIDYDGEPDFRTEATDAARISVLTQRAEALSVTRD